MIVAEFGSVKVFAGTTNVLLPAPWKVWVLIGLLTDGAVMVWTNWMLNSSLTAGFLPSVAVTLMDRTSPAFTPEGVPLKVQVAGSKVSQFGRGLLSDFVAETLRMS